MQYPLYVHRTGDTSFRASFPDFPRAVAHGESMAELKADAKQAVELMYDTVASSSYPLRRAVRQSCMRTR
jgi:predicted RNase H-like HicB family nuclease